MKSRTSTGSSATNTPVLPGHRPKHLPRTRLVTYVRTIKYPWRFDCFADKAEKEPVNVVGGNTFITYEDLWRPRRITATMWPYYLNLYKYTLYCLQVYLARKTTHVRFRLFIQRITCGPYMATLYDWIPIFEWYERRLAVKNGNQETRLEWLPCSKTCELRWWVARFNNEYEPRRSMWPCKEKENLHFDLLFCISTSLPKLDMMMTIVMIRCC